MSALQRRMEYITHESRGVSMTDFKTAAAYIRVSTEDQVELSPASQLVEIRKWGAANGTRTLSLTQ